MTGIRLHDSASRRKRAFRPGDPTRVSMYVCGPTVYARAHIGNARAVVVFDTLFRLLRHVHGPAKVRYVRNITDIDDKIIAAAEAAGRDIEALTRETTDWFHQDCAALGALPPSHEPRATEHLPGMIRMIADLLAAGAAYEAGGHVLFATASAPEYGCLSGRSRAEMIAGARVEVAPYKRDPADFVLWKPSADDQPGWPSPWGRGRPGWHIECSHMATEWLGADFDIHGGGIDLLFPHHENERAQALAARPGSGFARYWLHNGFLLVEGRKMAKSLGNVVTVDALLSDHPGEAVRLALLASHYRQPLDWTARGLGEAETVLEHWWAIAAGVEPDPEPPAPVLAALADDLNTPRAISALHALARAGNAGGLRAGAGLLGLLTDGLGGWARPAPPPPAVAERLDALLAERSAARAAGDFRRADHIRAGLAAAGVELVDRPSGSEWRLRRSFTGTLPAEWMPEARSDRPEGGGTDGRP